MSYNGRNLSHSSRGEEVHAVSRSRFAVPLEPFSGSWMTLNSVSSWQKG